MDNTLAVTKLEAGHKLMEIISSDFLVKAARVGDVVEYFAAWGQLQHDEAHGSYLARILHIDVLAIFDLLDNILMLEDGHGSHFRHNEGLHFFVYVWLHNLNGDLLIGGQIVSKFDLAAGSLTESSANFIISQDAWHFKFLLINDKTD
jgi:hypothetical protein